MKNIVLLLGVSSLLGSAFAQSAPDMLERTFPGVLTIAVNETIPVKKTMGAASGADRLDKVYDRVLDLSDAKGSGSGFVIRRGGRLIVVTNAHVVEQARQDAIFAYSIKQTRYRLKLVGGDSFYDIALLEFVEPDHPGPEIAPLEFRTADPRVGETIYALGNPLGEYPYSVSQGIVGGRNRFLGGLTGRIGYLQHTASIIWGNSGGPLVDSAGRVAGVNTRIEIADRGQSFLIAQLNFALQSSVAQQVIDSLLANRGRIDRAYLGLELTQSVPANRFRKTVATEATIGSVVESSPAAALGKFKGYRVDRIGVTPVRNLDEAMAAIEALKPEQQVEFEVTRGNSTETVTIKTGHLSESNYAALARHVIATRSSFELREQGGTVVLERSAQRALTNVKVRQIAGSPAGGSTSVPQTLGIVAAGFVPERRRDEEAAAPMLYRVGTLVDLGVALRLLFMAGGADLVVIAPNSDSPAVLHWTLSSDPNVITRMLIA